VRREACHADRRGPGDVQTLIDWDVPFDLDDTGNVRLTREGGHSANRILHCGGDATGRGVTQRLAEIAGGRPNLWIRDQAFLIDVIVEDGETAGVVAWDNGYRIFQAPHVVLCTGGIGQTYEYTTNPASSTGTVSPPLSARGQPSRIWSLSSFIPPP
jgi:L-aspartate oxidase